MAQCEHISFMPLSMTVIADFSETYNWFSCWYQVTNGQWLWSPHKTLFFFTSYRIPKIQVLQSTT